MGEYVPTNDGRPLKTQDAMLDEMGPLYRTRRKTIATLRDFADSNPELAVVMEWILTTAVEVTEKEMKRT